MSPKAMLLFPVSAILGLLLGAFGFPIHVKHTEYVDKPVIKEVVKEVPVVEKVIQTLTVEKLSTHTVIAEGTKIDGSFVSFKATINGEIIGSVRVGELTIGEKGTVKGPITAKTMVFKDGAKYFGLLTVGDYHGTEEARKEAAKAEATQAVPAQEVRKEEAPKVEAPKPTTGNTPVERGPRPREPETRASTPKAEVGPTKAEVKVVPAPEAVPKVAEKLIDNLPELCCKYCLGYPEYTNLCNKVAIKFTNWQDEHKNEPFDTYYADEFNSKALAARSGELEAVKQFCFVLALYHEFKDQPRYVSELIAKHPKEWEDLRSGFTWEKAQSMVKLLTAK